MKEAAIAAGGPQTPAEGRVGLGNIRSAGEKEKTKLRERQRRAITTKIFHGLRKHGGYHLSPRADINEVLRELAREAGWVVQPDGTTYRPNISTHCPVCGAARLNGTPTSSIIGSGPADCSTTASPRQVPVGESALPATMPNPAYFGDGGGGGSVSDVGGGDSSSQDLTSDRDIHLALYMYGTLSGGIAHPSTRVTAMSGGAMATSAAYLQRQQFLQEARASNENTPVGSPQHRA